MTSYRGCEAQKGVFMAYIEENIAERAKGYYGLFSNATEAFAHSGQEMIELDKLNWNCKIVKGLSELIVKVWNEWKEDTRHYKPAKRDYERYMEIIRRAEGRLDESEPVFDLAKQVIKDSKKFMNYVVLYRVRGQKCRVM